MKRIDIYFTVLLALVLIGFWLSFSGPHAVLAQNSPTDCANVLPISTTTSAQLITGQAGKNIMICSVVVVVGGADNIALVEGTGTTCATNIAGMSGGTTAATGWNLAANGGVSHGSGAGTVLRTATPADNVCVLVSAASQLSGTMTWKFY